MQERNVMKEYTVKVKTNGAKEWYLNDELHRLNMQMEIKSGIRMASPVEKTVLLSSVLGLYYFGRLPPYYLVLCCSLYTLRSCLGLKLP